MPEPLASPHGAFTVKFRGDLNTVRAETFISAVTGQAAALHGIAAYVSDSKIDVRISAPRRGSFEFTIVLQALGLGVGTVVMFGPAGIEAVSKVISLFSGSLDLLKHLKGKPPIHIEAKGKGNTAITNVEGNVTIIQADVLNIYESKPEVPEALGSTFRAIDNEPAIDGVDVIQEDRKEPGRLLFTADRPEFGQLARAADAIRPDRKVETVLARIYPVKFVTEPGYKWSAYYKGNKISVSIDDEDFFKNMMARRFGHGVNSGLELTHFIDIKLTHPLG